MEAPQRLIFSDTKTSDIDLKEIPSEIISRINRDDERLVVSTMTFDELEQTRQIWAKAEGWPSIKDGMMAVYSLDPKGFYKLTHDKEKIATLSIVGYEAISFAYIGFFIVAPPYRGQYYGDLLFKEAMAHTEENRSIQNFGLNCLESMSPLYEKYGFHTTQSDSIWKYTQSDDSPIRKITSQSIEVSLKNDLFKRIVDFDRVTFGAKRTEFLMRYLTKSGTKLSIVQHNNVLKGYGVMSTREPASKEEHASFRIGPVYANNDEVASSILRDLIGQLQAHESAFLETSDLHNFANELMLQLGFNKVLSMNKMYKGTDPGMNSKNIYSYSSLVTGG